MKKIALLRGVTPTGQNRIPSMSDLVVFLEEAGLTDVKTYIQSGNIICKTLATDTQLAQWIHETIKDKIGADLAVVIKNQEQLASAVNDNPFDDAYDRSRVHLVFTNNDWPSELLKDLARHDFGDEELCVGDECLYMYLPRDAKKKRLNTNFLEKQLGITATMRKLSVISRLSEMAK